MPRFLRQLLDWADIGHSRTAVTNQLQWTMAISGGLLFLFLLAHAPVWLIALTGGLFALTGLTFLACFVYFARVDPDSLRSERYSIQKMAIEKGLVGDNLSGLFEEVDLRAEGKESLLLGEAPDEEEEHEQ
jgi:hypothetical protein